MAQLSAQEPFGWFWPFLNFENHRSRPCLLNLTMQWKHLGSFEMIVCIVPIPRQQRLCSCLLSASNSQWNVMTRPLSISLDLCFIFSANIVRWCPSPFRLVQALITKFLTYYILIYSTWSFWTKTIFLTHYCKFFCSKKKTLQKYESHSFSPMVRSYKMVDLATPVPLSHFPQPRDTGHF